MTKTRNENVSEQDERSRSPESGAVPSDGIDISLAGWRIHRRVLREGEPLELLDDTRVSRA